MTWTMPPGGSLVAAAARRGASENDREKATSKMPVLALTRWMPVVRIVIVEGYDALTRESVRGPRWMSPTAGSGAVLGSES